jgi:uncharacterized membrane protein
VIVLLLLLLVVVVVFAVGVITGSGDSANLSVFGFDRSYDVGMIFLVGVCTGLLALLLVVLLGLAMRRARRKRLEHAELERRRDELERERAALDERLGTRPDDAPDVARSRFDPEP